MDRIDSLVIARRAGFVIFRCRPDEAIFRFYEG